MGKKPDKGGPPKQPEKARRTYDEPNKGVMWGKEVPGYVDEGRCHRLRR